MIGYKIVRQFDGRCFSCYMDNPLLYIEYKANEWVGPRPWAVEHGYWLMAFDSIAAVNDFMPNPVKDWAIWRAEIEPVTNTNLRIPGILAASIWRYVKQYQEFADFNWVMTYTPNPSPLSYWTPLPKGTILCSKIKLL